jgi:hypothetical protein
MVGNTVSFAYGKSNSNQTEVASTFVVFSWLGNIVGKPTCCLFRNYPINNDLGFIERDCFVALFYVPKANGHV